MALHIHEREIIFSTASMGVIEIIHEMPISEIFKLGLQSSIGLLTIIYLIFRILNERKKLKS